MKKNDLTEKDLSYIKDAFEWNYITYIKLEHFISLINDDEAIKLLENINKNHKKICKKLLSLTGGTNE